MRFVVGASVLLLTACLIACGPTNEPSAQRTRRPPPTTPAPAPLMTSTQEHALSIVTRTYVAREMSGTMPRDVRSFSESGPVGLYLLYEGATNDTIVVQLLRGGRSVDRCAPAILNGDSGYFCRFDYVSAGEYEIAVHIDGFSMGTLPFTVQADVASPVITPPSPATDAITERMLSQPPWARRPNERDLARVYPSEALRRHLPGRVLLRCRIRARGAVDCEVAEEAPSGFGFGEAALQLSRSFRMRTRSDDGSSTLGANVEIPVRFEAP